MIIEHTTKIPSIDEPIFPSNHRDYSQYVTDSTVAVSIRADIAQRKSDGEFRGLVYIEEKTNPSRLKNNPYWQILRLRQYEDTQYANHMFRTCILSSSICIENSLLDSKVQAIRPNIVFYEISDKKGDRDTQVNDHSIRSDMLEEDDSTKTIAKAP